jgi:WD40 repeat protein
MDTGRLLRQLPEDAGLRKAWLQHNTVVALSADARTAGVGLADGSVHLLDAATGREGAVFVHRGLFQEVALSADGRVLASRSDDGTLRVWDVAAGRERRQLTVPAKQWRQQHPAELALSPDGRTLAWVGAGPECLVHVCDAATGEERHRLADHKGFDRQVALSPDGGLLLTASDGGPAGPGFASLWDLKTGKVVHSWKSAGGGPWLATPAFAPDGKTLLLNLPGDARCRLDVATGKELWRLPRRTASTAQDAFAFTPDGKLLIDARFGGPVLQRHDLATGKRILAPGELEGSVSNLAFSPEERAVYVLGEDSILRTFELATGKEVRQTPVGPKGPGAISPDGRFLAVWGEGALLLHETAKGREVWRTGPGWPTFSPDGRVLGVRGGDTVELREASTGK